MLDDFLCERQSDEMYNEIMAYEAELEYEEEERRQAFEAHKRAKRRENMLRHSYDDSYDYSNIDLMNW
jgi:hypothetical protein